MEFQKEISENLNVVAPKFKDELITSSATLTTQIKEFESAYSTVSSRCCCCWLEINVSNF